MTLHITLNVREHRPPRLQEFSILGGNYHKNKFHKKVAESLFTKEKSSTFSTQEKCIPLKLFN